MIPALALYFCTIPAGAFAGLKFGETRDDGATVYTIVGGLFPPAGAVLALLMLFQHDFSDYEGP